MVVVSERQNRILNYHMKQDLEEKFHEFSRNVKSSEKASTQLENFRRHKNISLVGNFLYPFDLSA